MTQLQPATPDTTSLSGFAAMFEASETTAGVEIGGEGQIVSGTVVQVHHDSVIVDIGGKSEGVISKSEFVGADGTFGVKVGDKVDVFIESRESDDGPDLLVQGEGRQDEGVGRDLRCLRA